MKTLPPPSIEYERKKVLQRYENTPVAYVVFEAFALSENTKNHKKITLFYKKMHSRFWEWTEKGFYKYAVEKYSADKNPRKKYRYVPLELKYSSKAELKNEKLLDVSVSISLYAGKTVLSEKHIRHRWDLQSCNMRIIRQKKQRSAKKNQCHYAPYS